MATPAKEAVLAAKRHLDTLLESLPAEQHPSRDEQTRICQHAAKLSLREPGDAYGVITSTVEQLLSKSVTAVLRKHSGAPPLASSSVHVRAPRADVTVRGALSPSLAVDRVMFLSDARVRVVEAIKSYLTPYYQARRITAEDFSHVVVRVSQLFWEKMGATSAGDDDASLSAADHEWLSTMVRLECHAIVDAAGGAELGSPAVAMGDASVSSRTTDHHHHHAGGPSRDAALMTPHHQTMLHLPRSAAAHKGNSFDAEIDKLKSLAANSTASVDPSCVLASPVRTRRIELTNEVAQLAEQISMLTKTLQDRVAELARLPC